MGEIKDIPSSFHQDRSQKDKEPEKSARYLREGGMEREGWAREVDRGRERDRGRRERWTEREGR